MTICWYIGCQGYPTRDRRRRTRRGRTAAKCVGVVQAFAVTHRTRTNGREFSSLSLHGMKTAKPIAPQA
jgi:hypothetical protein